MKSGAIVLLLGLLAVWAQLPPTAAQMRPGACPIIRGPGTCVERCWGDYSCPPGRKCCSNGCGHVCMTPVTRLRGLVFPPQACECWCPGIHLLQRLGKMLLDPVALPVW
ncbi:Extracellular peptidase inhibitor [Chelonia mydas]|uniref:Extracellular peptidase inhibitor n=1 Tax=Chelonia mydas TaxID=8469 RepID=M7AKT2_CHEMY|nr:Extracellular peptidase inhibitor [Chelonia mydas]